MSRSTRFYVSVLFLFAIGIGGLLRLGTNLETGRRARPPAPTARSVSAPGERSTASPGGPVGAIDPFTRLLLQMIVIVLAARLLGRAAEAIGQPRVIGEIVAGILLGPSLFGALFPAGSALIFPAASLATLRLLAQIGIVLFLFTVGLDLDIPQAASRARAAVAVSHASILLPFLLGVSVSLFLFRNEAPSAVSFRPFALFMGIAMSITAFPVLARILAERGLARTPLGTLAITCAAVDDVTAWSLLAVVVAIATPGGWASGLWTLVLVLLFAATMLFGVRPLLARTSGARLWRRGGGGAAAALLFAFVSAVVTELIGIHALFGAFLAGTALPSDAAFRRALKERLDGFGSVLLPLFFAFTGLRMEIGLLSDIRSWLVCGALILVATFGKLGGTLLAARWSGLTWNQSFVLGALMNTRGLVELVVLNLGFDLGILSPRIFVMMVLMALTTTFLTGPLLTVAARWRGSGAGDAERLRLREPSDRAQRV